MEGWRASEGRRAKDETAFRDQEFVGARQLVRASGSLAAVAHCKAGRPTARPGAPTCERIQLIDPRARAFDSFSYL